MDYSCIEICFLNRLGEEILTPLNWDLSIYTEEQAHEFVDNLGDVYRVDEVSEPWMELMGKKHWNVYMDDPD